MTWRLFQNDGLDIDDTIKGLRVGRGELGAGKLKNLRHDKCANANQFEKKIDGGTQR